MVSIHEYSVETLFPGKITILDDCMPRSEAYRANETSEKHTAMQVFVNQIPPVRARTLR